MNEKTAQLIAEELSADQPLYVREYTEEMMRRVALVWNDGEQSDHYSCEMSTLEGNGLVSPACGSKSEAVWTPVGMVTWSRFVPQHRDGDLTHWVWQGDGYQVIVWND